MKEVAWKMRFIFLEKRKFVPNPRYPPGLVTVFPRQQTFADATEWKRCGNRALGLAWRYRSSFLR